MAAIVTKAKKERWAKQDKIKNDINSILDKRPGSMITAVVEEYAKKHQMSVSWIYRQMRASKLREEQNGNTNSKGNRPAGANV